MISGLQVLGMLFALTTSFLTYVHYKRREFTLREFLAWELIWLGFIAGLLFPSQIQVFASSLGAIRALDFFTIIGFVIVLSICFYTYVNVDRVRKQLEETIRTLALREVEFTGKKERKK